MRDLIKETASYLISATHVVALTGRISKFLVQGKAGKIMHKITAEVDSLIAAKRR